MEIDKFLNQHYLTHSTSLSVSVSLVVSLLLDTLINNCPEAALTFLINITSLFSLPFALGTFRHASLAILPEAALPSPLQHATFVWAEAVALATLATLAQPIVAQRIMGYQVGAQGEQQQRRYSRYDMQFLS